MNKYTLITLIGLIGLMCLVPSHLKAHVYDENGEFAHPATGDAYAKKEGYGPDIGFVYGRSQAWAHYKFPMATGLHSAYICNYSGGLPEWPNKLKGVRFYCDFKSEIWRKERGFTVFEDSDTRHYQGFLDSYWSNDPDDRPGYWWKDHVHIDFDLSDEVWGEYTLEAESVILALFNADGVGAREDDEWRVKAILEDFDHEEEPMGIDDW